MTSSKKTATEGHQTELVATLADIAKRLDLSEIEYELGGLKVRVARQLTTVPYQAQMPAPEPARAPTPAPAATTAAAEHPGTVKSPMVGTAYLRPAPESAPFVDLGSTVKAGDKILLVEAMKTFNEIIAPKAGTVTQILVADGEPVEYGQSLFVIE
jgi:acetyl-CoA carboxylase biotin carboxyl carrier protein